ncbi:MAG: hypothetical protein HYX68_05715 [Planctomycetes bacterium]|nr:hypothetical protein [Planctomycetota bacterium]
MKVAELQQFLSQIVPFARAAGAGDKVAVELDRAVLCLAPFKDKSLAEFNDFLRLADEYVRTGRLPEKPARVARPRTPKAPKLTVAEAAQKFQALYARATDPTLEYPAIDAEIDTLSGLTIAELKEVAAAVDTTVPSKSRKKDEILAEFKRKIKERKGSYERTQFRAGDISS